MSVESGTTGRSHGRGGLQHQPSKRQREAWRCGNKLRGKVGTDEQGCDQQGILPLSLKGRSDKIGEAGFVRPNTPARRVMPQERATTAAGALAADIRQRLHRVVGGLEAQKPGEVLAQPPLRIRAVMPEPQK